MSKALEHSRDTAAPALEMGLIRTPEAIGARGRTHWAHTVGQEFR